MPSPLQFTSASGAPVAQSSRQPSRQPSRQVSSQAQLLQGTPNMKTNNNIMSNLMKLCAQSTGCRSCGSK